MTEAALQEKRPCEAAFFVPDAAQPYSKYSSPSFTSRRRMTVTLFGVSNGFPSAPHSTMLAWSSMANESPDRAIDLIPICPLNTSFAS